MIDNLQYNEKRQKDSIKIFEISDMYSKETKINQIKKIGIIISGRRGHNYLDFSKKLDRDYFNKLLNNDSNNSTFSIEEISRNDLKTKKKDKIFYTETTLDNIPEHIIENSELTQSKINFIKYKPISEFPSSTRDFSFLISDFKKYKTVIDSLSNLNDKNLKNAFIFDFYENNKLNEIKIGIRLTFQSASYTLSDEEIQESIENILKPIINIEGVSIPGY